MNIEVLSQQDNGESLYEISERNSLCSFCNEKGHSIDYCEKEHEKRNLDERIWSIYNIENGYDGYPIFLTERDLAVEEKQIIESNEKLAEFKIVVQQTKNGANISALKNFDWNGIDFEKMFPSIKKIGMINDNANIETLSKFFDELLALPEIHMDKAYTEKGLCHLYDPETKKFYTSKYLPCSWCGSCIEVSFLRSTPFGSRYCGCADTPRNGDW
jgi:hypothetical protein